MHLEERLWQYNLMMIRIFADSRGDPEDRLVGPGQGAVYVGYNRNGTGSRLIRSTDTCPDIRPAKN